MSKNKMSWSGKIFFLSLIVFVLLSLFFSLLPNNYIIVAGPSWLIIFLVFVLGISIYIIPYFGIVYLLNKFIPKRWYPKSKFSNTLSILVFALAIMILIWPGITFIFSKWFGVFPFPQLRFGF